MPEFVRPDRLTAPTSMPAQAQVIIDPPGAVITGDAGPYVQGAIPSSAFGGAGIPAAQHDVAPPPQRKPDNEPAKPPERTIQRIRQGGAVQSAMLIHKVVPTYPALARQARVSGTVHLLGVIGKDGRVQQLRILSGHPLLAGVALYAVKEFIFLPTLLIVVHV